MRVSPDFQSILFCWGLSGGLTGILLLAAIFAFVRWVDRRDARFLRQHSDFELLLSERRHGEIAAAARALRAQSQRIGHIGRRPTLHSIKGGKTDPKGRQG